MLNYMINAEIFSPSVLNSQKKKKKKKRSSVSSSSMHTSQRICQPDNHGNRSVTHQTYDSLDTKFILFAVMATVRKTTNKKGFTLH